MSRRDFDPSTVVPDDRKPVKRRLFDPKASGPWRGNVPGDLLAAGTTILTYGNEVVGEGPKLHVHPYDETFIVIEGNARFFVGDEIIDAQAGEIVFGPKGIPHRFENLGPGRLQTIDIHHSPTWLQTDLA